MSLRNGNECYHLSSLSVTKDGWVIAAPNNDFAVEFWRASTVGSDAAPAITSSCRKLMKACKVDFDDDLFTEQVDCQGEIANLPEATDNDRSDDDKNSPENPTSANSTPLEYLSHIPDLQNIFMKVISDVRRMGEPSNREKDKEHEQSQPENGISNGGKRSRRNNNRERGKIAQLEEQRRLRLEKQSQSQSEIRSNAQTEQSEQDDQDGDLTLPLDGFNNNLSNKNDENEGFIRVGKNHDIQPSKETMSPGWRLAVTFNSLRIFVSLLRPILDNPHRRDTSLKMKHGPSIKTSGEKHRNYLLSKHVYSCVSNVCWKELRREYVNVLALLNMGVEKMEQQDKASGRYEQSVKDWITSLFDYSQFTCEESLEKKCMDFEVLPSDQGSAILNKTLMDQFSYESGKKQDELKKSIQDLQSKLELAISRKFKGVRLTVYGSCLSGLALQGSHDVDVSIYIPEMYELKQKFDDGINSATSFEKQMRNIVFRVKNCLQYCRSESFDDLFAITRARVPVLKGRDINACNPYSPDGSLSFDLCFLNDIAVVNSSLLREYSLVDNRVRMLMLAVKSFAKKNKIASAADGTLSSYTWLNLVIFYLQCIGFVPNLQCRELMKQHDWHPDPGENPWHCINGLETYYLPTETMTKSGIWKQPDRFANTKIPNLLYGFLNFYAKVFPQQTTAVSIRFGKCTLQKTSLQKTSKIWRLCIEDPFETFDSHCLHDLGCHLDEGGQKKVMNCLAQTRDRLGDLLQQAALDDGLIQSFVDLFETSQKSGAKSHKHQTGQQGQKYSDKSRLASRIQPRRGNNDANNNGIKQKSNKGSTNTQTTKGPGQNQAVTEGSTRTFVVEIHNNDDDNQHSGGKRHHRIDQRQSKKQNATLAALEQSREKQNVPNTRNKGHRNRYSTKKRPPTNIPAKEMASATIATEGGNVGNGARSTNEDKDTTRQGNEMKNSNSGLQNKYAKKHNHKLSRNQKNNSTVQN